MRANVVLTCSLWLLQACSAHAPPPMAGGPMTAARAQAAPAAGQPGGKGTVAAQPEEQLVVEGWVQVTAKDVGGAARAIREHVVAAGGRVVDEVLDGSGETAASGTLQLRVPPGRVPGLLEWLDELGEVISKRIRATDVSKQLFDQALALENLELTRSRLKALLDKPDNAMADILAIEKELTRLRGEIERIKGEQRYLKDRVALASIEVKLYREPPDPEAVFAPHAKFHPGPRVTGLLLLDSADGPKTRLGGGLTLHFDRLFTAELDVFPATGGEARAVLATLGTAAFSDFLGRGRRHFGNPYLGLRMGYGHLDGSRFVVGADLGIELTKHEYLLTEVNLRVLGLIGSEGADAALTGTFGLVVPF